MSNLPAEKETVTVRAIFFGPLKDFFKSEMQLELTVPATVLSLRNMLLSENKLSEPILMSSRAAMKDEFIDLSQNIGEGDEIFFLPPASGG